MSNLVLPTIPGFDINIRREPLYNTVQQVTQTRQRLAYSYETYPLYRYTIAFSLLRSAATYLEFQQLAGFLAQLAGSLDNFLWQDPEDNAVAAHGFGLGDGATTKFQLQRRMLGGVYDVYGGPWARSSQPRTNLVTFSEQLDNAAWAASLLNTSVTADAVVAPDGNVTAEKVVATAASSQHYRDSAFVVLTSGLTYTQSIFAKAAGLTTIAIGQQAGAAFANFDLVAGAVTAVSGGTAAIVSCGNGWYRCALTYLCGSSGNDRMRVYPGGSGAFLGDGTSGVYAWGAQVEQFSSATQYIQTTSAAVTSAPAYWPAIGDGFEPVFDPAPGETIFVNGTAKVRGTDYTLALGLVTFTVAPAASAVLSWSGSFYRRVRFEADGMQLDRIVTTMWEAKQLVLIGVKGQGVSLVSTPLLPRTETPAGTINGTTGSDGNATFTLSHTPLSGTPVAIYRNGIRLTSGTDYTVAGAVINALAPNIPITGDSYVADYFAY